MKSPLISNSSNPVSPIKISQDRNLKDLFGNAVQFKDKDGNIGNNGGKDGGNYGGKDRRNNVSNSSQSAVSGAMSNMSEAHERLLERGEKLNRLTDKSADVNNAAEEFAKLAKQLTEQNKSRWF